MNLSICQKPAELGELAGKEGAALIKAAIQKKGFANIILATGTSQFETLEQLLAEIDIDWSKVTVFHLDEYLGLPITHPASFRKYLLERFFIHLPQIKAYFLINGEVNPAVECARLGELIRNNPIDVAFVGIGENGHLAFNDPPADFETDHPYIVVDLDQACRMQQFGEGWFPSLEAVPQQAISMSIRQIMKSKAIICSVPDTRKALAIKNCIEGSISRDHPASILKSHSNYHLFLDEGSSSLLSGH
ncbi:glucosamine-6-phosphate deaminase [Algoriphagus ratkowskyi]|uniref:Glucosamine-6-phosphate deaminase n=1 Tax=Algoriphagus ratkowskyi TaxID=57028 RepID=A0A2W7RCU7_9BACT|nr:glucosamine-6-phosphate deaminase [Algoriphagus ratkowskyi]PZX56946.1 glucosamine-6-phosphate deaminase [Algoriphagus ratkowskyi]TXD79857.1 glucosamine-6-phosphate deaminase [Algoriphagus ratkowskyi]